MHEMVARPPQLTPEQISAHTTIGVIWRRAERLAARPMLHYFSEIGTWESISWAGAVQRIMRIAAALTGHGVRAGDHVVIMSANRPEWILADFAIQLVGGVTVPVYPTLAPAAAREIAHDCGAVLAIVTAPFRNTFDGMTLRVVTVEEDVARWMIGAIDPAMEAMLGDRARALTGSDVATVIYTSGTTGSPKGVVLSHESLVTMAAVGAEAFALARDDVLLSFLPYSHVFERVEGILAPLTAGATIWISRGAQQLAADLQVARPTVMLLVPRVLEKMLTSLEDAIRGRSVATRVGFRLSLAAGRRATSAHDPASTLANRLANRAFLKPLRARLTGGRLRFIVSGGAPLQAEVERFFWAIGTPVYQGWGLTETTAAATANCPGAVRHGSVGRPLPGVLVRAAADGELLVKGPGTMREYLGMATATAEVLADGWLKTGDIGAIDVDGYVTITDRKKDLIKTSTGKYVAPQPLEARLQSYRYIAAAVVVGDQRPYIVALIQPAWDAIRKGLQLSGSMEQLAADQRVEQLVSEAIDAINRGLANFETIKRFRIVAGEFSEASGELTPSLKVRRRLVQQRYQRLIDEMYGSVSVKE